MTSLAEPSGAARWWSTAVVYEVYPRSFADSNADGIGDLGGLRDRLPYLSGLGVDALWLTPFYPSPLADGGYDVADYCDVDPRLGNLDDFDALVRGAHGLGLRLIIDIVPNHTSVAHAWFRDALAAAPGSAARARYIFRDGRGPGGELPPSDWRSHFGGSAWERVPDGQWYCHLFAPEQPDLNWQDDEVRASFLDVLRFWADRGVDGFRVDMAHTLVKDLSEPLRSQVQLDLALPDDGSDPLYDRDEVHTIYESWRELLDSYDPPRMAVAETWHPRTARSLRYAAPAGLGQVFDFSLLHCTWDRGQCFDAIAASVRDHSPDRPGTWVLSNHDCVRHASRLALPSAGEVDRWLLSGGGDPVIDGAVGARRARAATLLMLALPGSAYLYQGEELGLAEVADLAVTELRDPTWLRSGGTRKGRDGCRVPLPWTSDGPSFGFGLHGAWLPQPPWFAGLSVQAQDGVAGSSLELYRTALRLRAELQTPAWDLQWLDPGDAEVLHFRRANGWSCFVNFGVEPRPLPRGTMLVCSGPLAASGVPTDTTVWSRDEH